MIQHKKVILWLFLIFSHIIIVVIFHAPKQSTFNPLSNTSSAFSKPVINKVKDELMTVERPDSPTSKMLICEEPPKEQEEKSVQRIDTIARDGSRIQKVLITKDKRHAREPSQAHQAQEAAILAETNKILNYILSTAQRRYESTTFR